MTPATAGPVPVGAMATRSISDALERLLHHDPVLRADPGHPSIHAVHQARVATRRLRADLKTLRGVLEPAWTDRTRAELRWLGGVLGNVRDADVLAGHLSGPAPGAAGDAGGRAELLSRLEVQRRRAVGELAETLTSSRYGDLLDRLRDATGTTGPAAAPGGSGSDRPASQVLPEMIDHQWRVLRHRVRTAGRHPGDRELHRIRIGAKQLRYAAEMAAPVLGRRVRRTAQAAEALQTILGEHHDAVVAEHWLHGVALTTTPSGAYAAGRLAAAEHRRQKKMRRRWRSVWRELEKTRRYRLR